MWFSIFFCFKENINFKLIYPPDTIWPIWATSIEKYRTYQYALVYIYIFFVQRRCLLKGLICFITFSFVSFDTSWWYNFWNQRVNKLFAVKQRRIIVWFCFIRNYKRMRGKKYIIYVYVYNKKNEQNDQPRYK